MSLPSEEERFWARVNKAGPNGCWLWTAGKTRGGYGTFSPKMHVTYFAHRYAYTLTNGAVPDGLVLDHKCRVRHCVRPDHLEPVTPKENSRRGIKGVLTTHCPKGHPYDETNTRIYSGRRHCRACKKLRRTSGGAK